MDKLHIQLLKMRLPIEKDEEHCKEIKDILDKDDEELAELYIKKYHKTIKEKREMIANALGIKIDEVIYDRAEKFISNNRNKFEIHSKTIEQFDIYGLNDYEIDFCYCGINIVISKGHSIYAEDINFKSLYFKNCKININVVDNFCCENIHFLNCDIYALNFNQVIIKGNIKFTNSNFIKKSVFNSCTFQDNIYFNNSIFQDFADFHECEFEKTACFYGVKFDKVPNFSQAQFKGSLNAVNTNLDFDFKSLENKIEEEYKAYNHITSENKENLGYIKRFFKYLISFFTKASKDTEKYQKPIEHFANDFRDSFRVFKNALIKDNNLLDASNFHKYELYSKEIELDSKETKTLKDKVEKWQLWFYRKLCDHHTDILQSFHSLMLVIGLFGLVSLGVIVGFNYYYLGYKPIFSHLYMAKEIYDAHIQTFIKTHTLYTIACDFFILAFYLGILVYLISAKCLRRLFIGISYAVVICILLVSPKILIPAMGIFTDKRALLDPLSTLGGIYTICFGFVLFSFIKTIRKNSIVPN